MYDFRIPSWIPSQALSDRVARMLDPNGIRCYALTGLAMIRTFPVECGVWLLSDEVLADRLVREAIDHTLQDPTTPPVIILSDDPDHARLPHLHSVWAIIPVSTELVHLPINIRGAQFHSWQDRVARQVRQARQIPVCVRQAMIAILNQQIARPGAEGQVLRTVSELARRVGVSRGYLSRTATRHGIDIHAFADSYLALQALLLHNVSKASWEEIAWRMGFRTAGGVTQLLRRGLGIPIGQAAGEPIDECLVEWERRLAMLLIGTPEPRQQGERCGSNPANWAELLRLGNAPAPLRRGNEADRSTQPVAC
jgi:AraC-like DNA-binding protein